MQKAKELHILLATFVSHCRWYFYGSSVFRMELRNYSPRPELLVAQMDVSSTEIHLDTSISATTNSGQRPYLLSGLLDLASTVKVAVILIQNTFFPKLV